MTEHLIYSNYDLYDDEYMDEARENILDNVFFACDTVEVTDEYGKVVTLTREEYAKSITDEDIYREIDDNDSCFFNDELRMLRRLDTECNGIIAIASIGRWDGTFRGYKEYKNLADIMYSNCDYEKIYVDGYNNLRKEESHHDGSNSILFRQWKSNLTEEQKENFKSKIYNGKVTSNDISRYTTRLGHLIAREYGW